MRIRCIVLAASAFFANVSSVLAQGGDENRWSMQIGPARIGFHESAALAVAGAPVPSAGAELQDNTTLAAEISYQFAPAWSAGLTIGVPARTRIAGTGATEGFGEMGAGRYGPMAFTFKYALINFGRWHPYVGAGITYFVVLNEYDRFINDLRIDNAFGRVIQVGVQYDIDSRLGLFFDVKKLYVKTSARGSLTALGGAPVSADVRLDPAVFHVGISYRF